jgi:dihydroorotase
MQYATMFDKPLIQHCEDADMAEGGCMNAGSTALRLGLPGIPAMAEEMMIQRDLLIARNTQARYHVAHVSTAGGAAVIRDAKRHGITVTAEVCPHHLLLTEDEVETYDTNFKVNPPLRTRGDVEACIGAVADGTIDCLVTDHAPHGREDKETDFQNAPFGLVGLEVALGLFAKALILPGHLDWPGLIGKFTVSPARVLGLNTGTLEVGRSADVVVIDPEMDWVVDTSVFRSRSRNCPYDGWNLKGRATHTIVGGVLKWALDIENAVTAA